MLGEDPKEKEEFLTQSQLLHLSLVLLNSHKPFHYIQEFL